ncbi:hypothetical protein ACJX0J_014328, partial [Zea mays]
ERERDSLGAFFCVVVVKREISYKIDYTDKKIYSLINLVHELSKRRRKNVSAVDEQYRVIYSAIEIY